MLASLVDEAKKGDTKAAGLLVRHFLPKGKDLMLALTMSEIQAQKMAGPSGWDEPERASPSVAPIVQMPPPPQEEPGDSAFKPTG